MRFLEYLYYKYYHFQVRVGHGDIASFSAMLIISFTVMLYYFGIFFMVINLFPDIPINKSFFLSLTIILFFGLIIVFYLILVHKEKYIKIIKNDSLQRRSSLKAILFPLLAFILFNLGWILKMLQNQGRI